MIPVAGIGASAGGLDGVGNFLGAMPADSGCAFAVVIHLDPTHESAFASLLQRRTTMPVVQISDGTLAEPDRVYVIVPDRALTISGGRFQLREPAGSRDRFHPIDVFFESLAQDLQEQAIGVVLSGTGTNGTQGLGAIKAHGGLTLVQDPQTAQFDGMPGSAIAAGVADFVFAPDKMAEPLLIWLRRRSAAAATEIVTLPPPAELATLETILTLLQTRWGHDFSAYKRNTLYRRIYRRLVLTGSATLEDYAQRFHADRREMGALIKDLMITVTAFFRDPQAWETLDADVMMPMLAARDAGAEVRCWVPACASGEEAYSLAMLALERAETSGKLIDLKVFATDPQEDNLRVGRRGTYLAAGAEKIPPERLKRFFKLNDDAYTVNKALRERVVFAQHHLLGDPPFSRLDLISCRNLLMYLDLEAQRRVLALFHFALRPGGALFLGSSETVGRSSQFFQPISKKWRIYRRIAAPKNARTQKFVDLLPPREQQRPDFEGTPLPRGRRPEADRPAEVAQRAPPEWGASASVLIDSRDRVLFFYGAITDYLVQPPVARGRGLLALVCSTLRVRLRHALRGVRTSGKSVTFLAPLQRDDGVRPTLVTVVSAASSPGRPARSLLVTFQTAGQTGEAAGALRGHSEQGAVETAALAAALVSTRNELQLVIDRLQITGLDPIEANEQIISMNEELQAANEELEASKEELTSSHEELQTINAELKEQILQKEQFSDKLQNLLVSTDIATIFLDAEQRIDWFSPACDRLFDLAPADIGRPVSTFARKFSDPSLLADAAIVFDKLAPIEAEVRSDAGRWYLRRILPHRTSDDRVIGTVITFTDINDRKHAADVVDSARIYAETIVETIRQPLLVLDPGFRIRSANHAFYTMFSISAAETTNHSLYELQNHKWDLPAVRALLDEVAQPGAQVDDVLVEQSFDTIGHRAFALSARRLPDYRTGSGLILLAIEDGSARVREAQLQHDATHDELTGLPNRRELASRLRRAVSTAQQHGLQHALCYFDLDQFKLINDTAGHAAGDTFLKQVQPLLAGTYRERDTLARLGGDEFALLLENCSLAGASCIAETVIATLKGRRFDWEGRSFHVGASAGIVAITRRTESAAQALSQADVACYAAKESGRNQVMVYDGQATQPSAHHAQILVASTLRQALEGNRFRLFAQPIVSLTSSERAERQYEILIRMLDPEDRPALPETFVPAAERFGLMPTIDRWVIDTAFCLFGERLRGSDLGKISINLSGASLDTEELSDFVFDRLRAHAVPPERICFEITETAAVRNLDHSAKFIEKMQALGSFCALDDFGSGMSSFRYLRALAVDYLKIDGTFVEHLTDDPRDEAMVAAINQMAHALGITTIAEYAHSDAVVERLRHLGVDYAQGYAFGGPVPVERVL